MQEREIDLMDQLSLLDDMPGEVEEAVGAGVGLNTLYDNGLTRAQEAGAAAGYFRMREQFAGVAQNDPEAWAAFNRKYPPDKILDKLGRINGVPASWEATDEEREAAEQAEAERQSAQDMLSMLRERKVDPRRTTSGRYARRTRRSTTCQLKDEARIGLDDMTHAAALGFASPTLDYGELATKEGKRRLLLHIFGRFQLTPEQVARLERSLIQEDEDAG